MFQFDTSKVIAMISLFLVVGCANNSEDLKLLSLEEKIESPKTITLKVTDYCPAPYHRLSDFVLINESMKVEFGELRTDWDRDGLSNLVEVKSSTQFGIKYNTRDTNKDGYSDLLVYMAGITKDKQQMLKQCEDKSSDADSDRLTDCEEAFLGTDPRNWDTDGDHVPDALEVRVGLNPKDELDIYQDADNDGIVNYEEVKRNSPLNETQSEGLEQYAIQYKIVRQEPSPTPTPEPGVSPSPTPTPSPFPECYDVTISNVPLVPVSNGNGLRLYLLEQVYPVDNESFFAMEEYTKAISFDVEDKTEFKMTFQTLKEGGN